jgi:hypothetical protein
MVEVCGDDIAVRAHNRPEIADVATATISSERERMAPGLALVRAESGVNAERLAAPAVESVLDAVKTSWHSLVPFTMVSVLAMTPFWPNSGRRYGPCQVLPRSYEQK